MNRRVLYLALAITTLIRPALAAGQIGTLIHRQAPNLAFGFSSDTEVFVPPSSVVGQLVADRFIPLQSLPLSRVVFFGFYGAQSLPADPEPPQTESMRVRIYADDGTLPGPILREEAFASVSRMATGRLVYDIPPRREYRYEVTLSTEFGLATGARYWLEIAQLGDPASQFRWETAQGGEFVLQFPLGTPWQFISGGQMAYELWTPEPATAVCVGLGSIGLFLRRRRSRRI